MTEAVVAVTLYQGFVLIGYMGDTSQTICMQEVALAVSLHA